jgi:hypothetical protein
VWLLKFNVLLSIFNLNKQKHAASREKYTGNAQMFAETRWEMRLKTFADPFSRA